MKRVSGAMVLVSAAAVLLTTAVVSPASAKPNLPPHISGQPLLGSTLTAHPGSKRGAFPNSLKYQWVREPVPASTQNQEGIGRIAGATHKTYTPTSADLHRRLKVVIKNAKTRRSIELRPAHEIEVAPSAWGPPPAPHLQPKKAGFNSVTVSWDPVNVPDLSNYFVTMSSTTGNSSYGVATNATSYTFKTSGGNLLTYSFKVSVVATDDAFVDSVPSAAETFTCSYFPGAGTYCN